MTEQRSLELAGAVWCGVETRHKVVDPELGLEFARILKRECDKAFEEGRASANCSKEME